MGRAVRELLGFDYDTFVRAVVLPQGEFAAFLRSSPGKQREILRELLRLGVIEQMRARARRDRDLLVERSAALDRRLEEDYADATSQRLEDGERQLSDLRRRSDSTLRGQLRALEHAGRVRCERIGRANHWHLKEG